MNATNTFSEVSSSMGEIITNFEGRLRSVKFSKNDALLPLFEAVVNSIHAIEDRNAPAKSEDFIEIKIDRVNQTTINDDEKVKENAIQTITITDNGIGFTDANLQSFKTLDSDYKSNRGGKGIGRLVWLKAFAKVEIESVYIEGDEKQHRSIIFDHKNDVTVEPPAVVVNEAPCLTKVCLKNYYAEFAPTSSIESIGIKLLEHCIGYIVGNTNIPHITIIDGGKTLDISDLFDESKTCVTCETIVIGDNEFNLSHILFSLTKEQAPRMILTADGRAVSSWKLEPLVPGLIGRVQTESGVFDYFCRVSSSFLNKRVSSERNSFDIPLERSELKDLDISMEEIKAALLVAVKTYLHEFLKENKEKAKAHIAKYVAEIAPKYRPFLGRLPEDLPFSDTASYSEMDKYLHQHQYNIECKVLNEGRKILEARDVFVPEYEVRLNEYLKDIDDIKKSDLAGYVSHRKAVIELLKKLLKLKADGKYEAEASLHALILPMKCESTDEAYQMANLWLIDERLAFHDYLASDLPLKQIKITDSTSLDRPDALILQVYDGPVAASDDGERPKTALSIIEFKKPMRNDMTCEDKDPILQAIGYLKKIRKGEAKTSSGRTINITNQQCYLYIVCDLTSTMRDRCLTAGYKESADGQSFIGVNDNYKAIIEVLSYDALVSRAYERNYAFFEKLGLPSRR